MVSDRIAGQPQSSYEEAKLILSLARDGSVIQFNPECEHLTGFSRIDVINHDFTQILPADVREDWATIFSHMQELLHITSFTLPLQTKSNRQIPVVWNGFVVPDAADGFLSVCLIGEAQKPSSSSETPQPGHASETQAHSELVEHVQGDPIFAPDQILKQPNELQGSAKTLEAILLDLHDLSEKISSLGDLLQTLTTTTNSTYTMLAQLSAELQSISKGITQLRIVPTQQKRLLKPGAFSLRNLFGIHSKKKQLVDFTAQLDQRKLELNQKEEYLLSKAQQLELRLDEFCVWKEKLKSVEEEIERRRTQSEASRENINSVLLGQTNETDKIDDLQPLGEIKECAVVVQRGIIKQTNSGFDSLIGYAGDELLEHSLYDFIALDGLGKIEKYYLDRLKGDKIDGYSTILATKTNNHIPINVRIKSTRFNGEKAEMLIVESVTS